VLLKRQLRGSKRARHLIQDSLNEAVPTQTDQEIQIFEERDRRLPGRQVERPALIEMWHEGRASRDTWKEMSCQGGVVRRAEQYQFAETALEGGDGRRRQHQVAQVVRLQNAHAPSARSRLRSWRVHGEVVVSRIGQSGVLNDVR